MEFTVEDVSHFLTWNQLGNPGSFGTTYTGRIPANNRFGIEEMDVAIQVSHKRRTPQSGNLQKQFENELKLCHIRQKNIVRLIGFSSSTDRFYLVYEMVHGKSLSDIMNDLSWVNMLKILKAMTDGISYLHNHENGPYILCNISADNILVSQNFIPKIINFKHCVLEGETQIGGTVGYYCNKKEGKSANTTDDVLAFGILAMQLLTKSRSTTISTGEGSNVHVKHILDVYVPQFNSGVDLAHRSYGRQIEERKVTELVIGCLKKNGRVDIATLRKNLCLLNLTRHLIG